MTSRICQTKLSDMIDISLREFLRDFPKARKLVQTGRRLKVQARDAVFIFFELKIKNEGALLTCCKDLAPSKSSKVGPLEDHEAWESNK